MVSRVDCSLLRLQRDQYLHYNDVQRVSRRCLRKVPICLGFASSINERRERQFACSFIEYIRRVTLYFGTWGTHSQPEKSRKFDESRKKTKNRRYFFYYPGNELPVS